MEEQEIRVRIPRQGEILGVVISIVGGSRMMVECYDGKQRMCRIPGRIKNKVWIKDGDMVLVKPWEIKGEKYGDIEWRYKPIEVSVLKKRGLLKRS